LYYHKTKPHFNPASYKIIFSVGKVKTQQKQKLILLPFLTDVAVASVAVVPVVVAVVVVATCCFCWRVCNQNAHFPEKRSQKNKKKLEGRAAGRDGGGGQQGGANRHIDRLNGVVGFE